MQDVEEFIDNLPRDERLITRKLRSLIISAEPRVTEKLAYGVPYFSRYRRLFFLWPATAIPDSSKSKKAPPKVTFGFCYGNLLSNAQRLLVAEGRKQVYTIPFSTLADVNERVLTEVINEALVVDQQFFGKK